MAKSQDTSLYLHQVKVIPYIRSWTLVLTGHLAVLFARTAEADDASHRLKG